MDQCVGCHEANQPNNITYLTNMLLIPGPNLDSPEYDLAPDAEWRWSPLGLGGRDVVFLAQLESELNIADRQPGLAPREACIQTLCLSCHGAAGQKQLAIDTAGQGPPYALCNPLLPPSLRGDPTQNGPVPYTRDLLTLWDGSAGDPANFKYGALGREGGTCTICHHATSEGLGTSESFTGNLKFGPANNVYGPFPNPKQVPMQQAIGTTPLEAPWVLESGICGSCHAIYLPVANNQGEVIKFAFEQTTYLEWLNSDYAYGPNSQASAYGPKSCQFCHMRTSFYRNGQPCIYRVSRARC
ncbi:MAG: hypothetical protein AB1847_16265 [bacterium]